MTDHSQMKLGKKPPQYRSNTPRLANYVAALPAPLPSLDLSTKLQNLGMMLNDRLGDCTCATVGHIIQTWTSLTRPTQLILPDSDIEALYEGACGYNPADPSTDQGGIEAAVLDYWRDTGIAGDKIVGWCSIQPGDHDEVKQGLMIFGSIFIGVDLPISCQKQDVWDVPTGGPTGPGAPGSWGGHAIPVVAYDADGLTVITWGTLKKMTWAFWDAYCDEAHGPVSQDWLENGKTPEGFAWSDLLADMALLGK